ncbi:MAG: hypothetical protein LCH81_05730 [Bacteroidetes bacterium]|nr:hypothetical protein [Bacteroidota bacterium]
MRHKSIKNIKTRIRNKKQLVIVEFENNEFVFLSPNNISQNTGLEIFELELLIGSTLRIEFYKKGDKMFNGSICDKDNLIVKEYFFELKKEVERLRIEDKNQILGFRKIKKIFYFYKFGKDNVGIQTEDDSVTFISLKRFEIQSSLNKSEQHILTGSYIFPEFYMIGETLHNGTPVTQDNKILKWINLRYSDKIENMHQNFENSIGYYNGKEYSNTSDDGPGAYGYDSWEEMTLHEALDGDSSNYWNID